MILAEKIERKVYVNQEDFVSHVQLLMRRLFILSFLRDLLTSITCTIYKISVHVVSDIQTRAEGERYVQYNTNASTYEICKVLM